MKYLIIFFVFFIYSTITFSQEARPPFIKGYEDYREYFYFDSINKLCVPELACLDSMYEFFVIFKVDANATIVDFQIMELPISKLPSLVKSYIEKVFKASNGLWMPQIKDGHKVVSDEIVYLIDIAKRNKSISESVNESKKFIEYLWGDGLNYKVISQLFMNKDWNWLAIRY